MSILTHFIPKSSAGAWAGESGSGLPVQGWPKSGRMEAPPRGGGRDLVTFWAAVADLFASRELTHCPLFFSLGRDNPPLGTDALAHQWPKGLKYVFPRGAAEQLME